MKCGTLPSGNRREVWRTTFCTCLGVIMKKMRLAHVAEPLLNLGRQYST